MPLIDMLLNELKSYNGSSPLPKDFDIFWNNTLSEIVGLEKTVTIEKAEYDFENIECYDLYFNGLGSGKIYAKYAKPAFIKDKHGAVILFHGYSGASEAWTSLLSWASQGYSVFALDVRGQAGKSEDVGGVTGNTLNGHFIRGLEDSPEKLLFRYIFSDTVILARIAMNMEEVNENQVYTFGGSQGGALSLVCSALEPKIAKSVIIYPFLSDYKRVWDMDLVRDAYGELNWFFKIKDPLHEKEDEIFYKLGYIDVQNLANKVKSKVLFVTGLMDAICPPSTQFAVYNKITSEKEILIYPDFGHEYLPNITEKSMIFFRRN